MKVCEMVASVALACGLGLGAGCHSSKDKVSQDAVAVPDVDEVPSTPHAKLGYRLDWQGYPAVSGRATFFELVGDAIAVIDSKNNLTVMDTSTGRNRWSTSAGHRLERIVGVAGYKDELIVCSETECQVFDIRSGKLDARHTLAALANTPPVVVRDVAVMGCSNGELLGHSLSTGYKAWGFMLGGTIAAPPALMGGYDVGAVSQNGDVIIVDASSGSARGRLPSVFAGLANAPVASDHFLFIASLDQSVYAFERESGARAWRVRTESPIRAQPVYNEGKLYIALTREGLVCLDANSGTRVWANAGIKGTVIGSHNGALLVQDGATIHRLRPDTGETIESVVTQGIAHLVTDKFTDGALYTIGPKGFVQKFVPAF